MEKILLFIPCYNCEKQIKRVILQLAGEIMQYVSEVVFINNRSTDNTESVIQSMLQETPLPIPAKILRNNENYGLGGSHKVAFRYAKENGFGYVIVLHGDDQGRISDLLPYMRDGVYKKYDCVLGARFMKGSSLQGYSRFRTIGNIVYDLLFSIGIGKMVYDLGSGLNLYSVNMLQDDFYDKYKDNLMFNYCMILGSAYKHLKMKFVPISWREDDQVSNVKMISQAFTVLGLLISYMVNRKRFIQSDHRDHMVEQYAATIVFIQKERS